MKSDIRVTALAGGVGGAKLVTGLAQIISPDKLKIIVNTGDDFEQYGLYICPDIDSVAYSLTGLTDPKQGFGRKEDTYLCFDTLNEFGDNPWFRLGDKDLALHLKRTQLLSSGLSLTQATEYICKKMGILFDILPMCNDPVYTTIETIEYGEIPFQEYFVKHSYQPVIKKINYKNSKNAKLSQKAEEALVSTDIIIICPSNPWLSIFPIFSIPNVEDLLSNKKIIAISPIIGNSAIKGPAAKIFTEMGKIPSAFGIAEIYQKYLSGIVIDNQNADEANLIESLGMKVGISDIMMKDNENKKRVAIEVMDFINNKIII